MPPAEGERLGALSDARLPNNEAAEEHFDGSQIRVENRQFRALLKLANPSVRRRKSGSKPATYRQADGSNLLGVVADSDSGDRLGQERTRLASTRFRNRQWRTDAEG